MNIRVRLERLEACRLTAAWSHARAAEEALDGAIERKRLHLGDAVFAEVLAEVTAELEAEGGEVAAMSSLKRRLDALEQRHAKPGEPPGLPAGFWEALSGAVALADASAEARELIESMCERDRGPNPIEERVREIERRVREGRPCRA